MARVVKFVKFVKHEWSRPLWQGGSNSTSDPLLRRLAARFPRVRKIRGLQFSENELENHSLMVNLRD